MNGWWIRRRRFFLILSTLSCAGCSSLTDPSLTHTYSHEMAPVRQAIHNGQLSQAVQAITPSSKGASDYYVKLLERGRLAQLQGHYQHSQQLFQSVINHLKSLDSKAQYRLSNGIENGIASVTNDSALRYIVPRFEQVMLHHYQAINYLHQGSLTGALVEIRQAEHLQQQDRDKDPKQYKQQIQQVMDHYPSYAKVLGQGTQHEQNGYTYLFSSALYMQNNQWNDAYIDLKRALSIAPRNQFIGSLTRYVASHQDRQAFKQLRDRYPAIGSLKGKGMVWIFIEQQLIPYRQGWRYQLPVPIDGRLQYWALAFPILPQKLAVYTAPEVVLGGQKLIPQTASFLQSIATGALSDEMPELIVRQLTRLAAKATLTTDLSHHSLWLGFLANVYAVVTEHADTRSWETLPSQVRFAMDVSSPGTHVLTITGENKPISVPVKSGHITLVFLTQLGQNTLNQVITL